MHQIQCQCGTVKGHIQDEGPCNRIMCYCADCQAFAKFLGHADEILDTQGGTEIVQVAQPRLTFSQGKEYINVVRLSDKGILRWYASCCNTAIGNTPIDHKSSFVGLIHSSLDRSMIDTDFGKNIAMLETGAAKGEPKPKQSGLFGAIARFLLITLTTRISGKYKKSQLFDESGNPVVKPKVLTAEELKSLQSTI